MKNLRLPLILAFLSVPLFCGTALAACVDDGFGNIACDALSGTETDNSLSGITLIKTGAGETVLTGNNDFTSVAPDNASVTINDGTLSVSTPASLTGDFKLNLNGGAFKTEGIFSFGNEIVFGGGSVNVFGEGSVLSFTGLLGGAGFSKDGVGLLMLNNSSLYTGTIAVNEGGIVTNAASFGGNVTLNDEETVLVFDGGGTYGGNVSGSGTFVKDGAGTLVLTGGNSAQTTDIDGGILSISRADNLTGDLHLGGGSLLVTDNVILGGAGAQTITFEDGGINVQAGKTLTLSGGVKIETMGCDEFDNCSEVIKDGAGTLAIDAGATARYFADTNIKQGTLQIADGNSLGDAGYAVKIDNANLTVTDTTTIDNHIEVLANTSEVNIADGKNVTLNADTQGAGILNKSGTGTLILGNGVLGHSGGTVVAEGALQGNSANLSGNIQIDGYASLNILQNTDGSLSAVISGLGDVNKSGSGILTLNTANPLFLGDFNILGGSIKGSSQAISSGVNLSSGTSVIFDQNCTDADCKYNSVISGGGSLVKTGDGLLVLTGANTYTGGTYLQNTTRDSLGILFGADNALGAAGRDIFISRSNLSLDQNKTVSTNRNFIFSELENSITVLDNSVYTINGILQGTSFTKLGNGELVLTGANTHYGGTQITQGILSAYDAGALGSGILSVTGGIFKPLDNMEVENNIYLSAAPGQGGFLVDNNLTLTLNGIVSGGGTLNKKGTGILELGYYNSYMGGVYAEAGLLRGNTESILGDITVLSGATVEFKQDFDGYYTGDINSAGTITKTGLGMVIAEKDQNSLSVGTLNVNEGVFIARSELSGTANVASGAILSLEQGGEGHYETSGTIYLSHTGEVDLKGDIVVKDGGVLGFFIEEGKSSKINVKDTDVPSAKGNITIEDGGKIDITATGTFATPGVFNFLTYEGNLNITGNLEDIEVTVGNNRRLKAEIKSTVGGFTPFALTLGPDSLYLVISRLLSTNAAINGLKYNQLQIAGALDAASAAPSTDLENILNAIEDLPAAQQPQALTQTGGFIYANLPNYFNRFKDNAYLRINRTPAEEDNFSRNIWVQSVNNYADIKANENSEEIYNFSSGFAVGFDKYFENAGVTAGLFAGYARHDLKHNKTENLSGDEYQLGAYALKQGQTFDFKGAFSLGYQADEIERNISFAGRKAQSRVTGFGINLDAEAGVKIYDVNNFIIRPFAGLTGGVTKTDSFQETGADSINLSSDGNTAFLAQGRAGIGVEKRGKSFSYYADISAKQNLNNPEYALNVAGQEYKIKSADIGTLFGLNIGAVKRFTEAFSAYGDVGVDVNGVAQNYYLNIGLRSYW